jgi:hypothetical protein
VRKVYELTQKIFNGSKIFHKTDKVQYKKELGYLEYLLQPLEVYSSKFISFISLFVLYKYYPSTYEKFLELIKENINNKEEYYKFKNILTNSHFFIKQDMEFILSETSKATTDELFLFYTKKKISLYGFYFLLKDKNLNQVQTTMINRIGYIFQFLKTDIDHTMYDSLIIEDGSKQELF